MSRKLEANMNVIISICLQIFAVFLLNEAIYCSITELQACKSAEKPPLFPY